MDNATQQAEQMGQDPPEFRPIADMQPEELKAELDGYRERMHEDKKSVTHPELARAVELIQALRPAATSGKKAAAPQLSLSDF